MPDMNKAIILGNVKDFPSDEAVNKVWQVENIFNTPTRNLTKSPRRGG